MSEEKHLVLLKLEAGECRVFFVLKQSKQNDDWKPENYQYFYEKHSCPTNWFHDIVAVIEDGDADPHGFLDFVAVRDIPEGFDPDRPGNTNSGIDEAEVWAELFPELNDGPVIDGDAVDVSRALPAK